MLWTPVGVSFWGGLHQTEPRSGNDTAMNNGAASQHVGDFARVYAEIHGQKAHEEALNYALVVHSMGDRQEYDFWVSVAEALHADPKEAAKAA